ncbi:MAG TPA: TIGR03936 family radical SAM-associated protein [Candidatus Angelobacter sp.]|nr:TIGR03936 family radical SAM-associated protein [Candidatus Angelobacter sp.]
MARQAPVRDAAPTVQRLRLRYAKRGRLRFTSTRDFQRALERALRRTGVPMAYSQGFNPHPRISYTNAAPTGTASEAEYVELAVTTPLDPEAVRTALDAALPPGLDVLEVVAVRTPDFAERLEASVWVLELPGVATGVARAAVAAFLAADEIPVQRLTKSGMRSFDARRPVVRLEVRADAPAGDVVPEQPCAILDLVVRHVTPSVRPDDVLAALRLVADLVPPVPSRVTRLAQGPLVADASVGPATDAVTDPLAPDRG